LPVGIVPVTGKLPGAVIGLSLTALLLTGSSRTAAVSPPLLTFEESEIRVLTSQTTSLYDRGEYVEARVAFRTLAQRAENAGFVRLAGMNWNNAGVCSLVQSQFRVALEDFLKARHIAESAHEYHSLFVTLNSLANLYIHMGQFDLAMRIANEALAIRAPAENPEPEPRTKLRLQLATALAEVDRLGEAEAVYRQAIGELAGQKQMYAVAVAWSQFGYEYLKAERFDDAEAALNEALAIMRTNNFPLSAGVLSGLARIKARQADKRAAEDLFKAALALPPNITPRHQIYLDRGQFHLDAGDLPAALADFRQARHIFSAMHADIVPVDRDRVKFESELSRTYEGLIDAGNRLARTGGKAALLHETFDAAEQNRLWSLQSLIPAPNDWRTKLPDSYWELLTRYQSVERAALANPSPEMEKKAVALRLELQQFEAAAAGTTVAQREQSPLAHVRGLLGGDTVLLSFHISPKSSWLWAVDRNGLDVYPLPDRAEIQSQIDTFGKELRSGTSGVASGAKLYRSLFSAVRPTYLKHTRWLLELDGPLYDLPFAALVVEEKASGPVYLVERADLQSIPGALLAERGEMPANGEFLGIGDPVYNLADSRYRGGRASSGLMLARLPNTSDEVKACAKAWNSGNPKILTGQDARIGQVRSALESQPAIIHFATHVVTEPGEFRSGLIALSLNPAGEMGLLGPKEIVARPLISKLVVMDGCHSGQGKSLPSAGLMGLTRAWLGAGATSVLATQWDIPDESAQNLMVDFYRSLRAAPQLGASRALREAQISALRQPGARQSPREWAGYFLLSRML
jgi:CHAT domain-containing protein/Tfp pilus assembly protein PilF